MRGAISAPRGNRQLSAKEYRDLAARWRQLAADATTRHMRNHLLRLARECEYLAGGRVDMTDTDDEQREEAGRPEGLR